MIKAAKIKRHNGPKMRLPACRTLSLLFLMILPNVEVDVTLLQPLEDVPHLEVDPVDGVADVLEHALVGHEEVAVFEAGLAAAGEEEEQRHTRAVGRATALPRGFQMHGI